jgi:Ser/Thr protein kinase RdoA (MazF antagonist)
MAGYMATLPRLLEYAELRNWQEEFDALLMPFYAEFAPCAKYLEPLWTHNDFHASNLTWTSDGVDAQVREVIDFGLADRTTAIHDVATAIERNVVEWLRMGEASFDASCAGFVHLDHLDALLAGYEEVRPLSDEEARGLVALLPLVHCEFALSETEYFLSVLKSEAKARLAYEGYFLGHAQWFRSDAGRRLLAHLGRWVDGRVRVAEPSI